MIETVNSSRREFNSLVLGLGGLAVLPSGALGAAAAGNRTLVFAQAQEPTSLNTAITTAAPATFAATKIFDGLVSYDLSGKPVPQLALSWDVSKDGLTIRFKLRPGVRWHDGKPFTSEDVAFSLLEVWKKYHGRGRTTFANVDRVETPSPLDVVLKLSKPAPYLLSCLAASESTILPKHLYAGSDVLTNPRNLAPIGTGPFRFAAWQRGAQLTLDRNPDYWDKPKPYLDRIVVRILPNATSGSIALETGAVSLAAALPFSDVARLRANKALAVNTDAHSYSPTWFQFEFNLDRPALRDVRVRQAFAHAIDRAFIAKNIFGNALPADSPVPGELTAFHASGLPQYPFDIARANALLDQAGLKPGAGGVRLRIFLDFATSSINTRVAAYLRSTLAKAGIALQARAQDQGEYINRVYTRRDFDTCMTGSGAGRDPAIGVQRYYWSKNFQPGVAFSNGPHYVNPQVDRLLETAQVELDPAKRRALYAEFQKIVMTELPYIPLVWSRAIIGSSRRVQNLMADLNGINGNFAGSTR